MLNLLRDLWEIFKIFAILVGFAAAVALILAILTGNFNNLVFWTWLK